MASIPYYPQGENQCLGSVFPSKQLYYVEKMSFFFLLYVPLLVSPFILFYHVLYILSLLSCVSVLRIIFLSSLFLCSLVSSFQDFCRFLLNLSYLCMFLCLSLPPFACPMFCIFFLYFVVFLFYVLFSFRLCFMFPCYFLFKIFVHFLLNLSFIFSLWTVTALY